MESCPALDMIGDYFTKTKHVPQLFRFCNIIIGIHEDDIPAYNASGRTLIEERKIKLKKEKEKYQRAENLQATRATKECVGKSLLAEF